MNAVVGVTMSAHRPARSVNVTANARRTGERRCVHCSDGVETWRSDRRRGRPGARGAGVVVSRRRPCSARSAAAWRRRADDAEAPCSDGSTRAREDAPGAGPDPGLDAGGRAALRRTRGPAFANDALEHHLGSRPDGSSQLYPGRPAEIGARRSPGSERRVGRRSSSNAARRRAGCGSGHAGRRRRIRPAGGHRHHRDAARPRRCAATSSPTRPTS